MGRWVMGQHWVGHVGQTSTCDPLTHMIKLSKFRSTLDNSIVSRNLRSSDFGRLYDKRPKSFKRRFSRNNL